MRKGLVSSVIIIGVFAAISVVGAHVDSTRRSIFQAARPAGAKSLRGARVDSRSYRSPGEWRKVVIAKDNRKALDQALALGAVIVADYQSFDLLMMDSGSVEKIQTAAASTGRTLVSAEPLTVRDDFNVLFLRSGAIDTTAADSPGELFTMGAGSYVGNPTGKTSSSSAKTSANGGLRLVQFVGPVKRAWLDQLKSSGFEVIAYVPNNGYLIRGDEQSDSRLTALAEAQAASGRGFIQWEGPFTDSYKIDPALDAVVNAAGNNNSGPITVAIQLARGDSALGMRWKDDLRSVKKMASAVVLDAHNVLNFTNLRIKIDPDRIEALAKLPTVVNIESWAPPRMLDEEADQIDAAQLSSDGTGPTGPGYTAWLSSRGFASNFNFAIDVTDSGIDRGSTDAANLHPDFLDSSGHSRLLYARDYTSDSDAGDVGGHGTLNMSVAAGNGDSAQDSSGYRYGLGIAPFAMLGASKIFANDGSFDLSQPYTNLISAAYESGARVFSNSWGAGSDRYTIDSEEYDLRVRDADPSQPGNQGAVICFSAGNGGPGGTIGDPSTAKNVISVGASENTRGGGDDGCGVTDSDSNNAEAMAFFSSGGPVSDGRVKPDIVAPGTHVEGAASQNPNFDGSGVCGGPTSPYFPSGQTLYTWSSGTSHSAPQVAGAAALARQYFINNGIADPSAALIKALLLNTTTYLTGDGAHGSLPQQQQGRGLLDLDRAFDDTPKIFINQSDTFTESGQEFVITGEIKDSTRPFRVTLAWTDAPGFSAFAPWVNNLDLEVTVNGQVYLGNNLDGQTSVTGGTPDSINNVEGVWLPAGTAGTFLVRVRATAISGDGVPGNSDFLDQDFGLVVYNGEQTPAPVVTLGGLTISSSSGALVQPGGTVSMMVNLQNVSQNALAAGQATLSTQTTGVTITTPSVDFPAVGAGESGQNQTPFVFTVASTEPCGSEIQFTLDVGGQAADVRIQLGLEVGDVQPTQFFADDIESGDSKWTHGAFKKKKKFLDTWSISTAHSHSGSSSWFSEDPPVLADAHLDTIPIQLPAGAQRNQLVFYHTFSFEPGAFDGGVIEISTGGGQFQDLGPNIISGGYTGTVTTFLGISKNHIAGQPAWVEGRLGGFQKVVVDLSSFAGQTVVIRFRFCSDQSGNAPGWYIDDVSVNGNLVTCSPVQ